MVWMTAWSHWSWLVVLVETWTSAAPQGSLGVRLGTDTVQHVCCDTDSECKCGLMGTCLYLGSLRKSLSNRSDTVSGQTRYQRKGIPKETGSFGLGYS